MYLSAAALTSLFAASCASDDVPEINADGMTSFQVQLPEELGTRTFGDGNSATNLYVAIYDAADSKLLFSNFPGAGALNGMKVVNFTERQATVTVPLVKNKTYNIVLWAQNGAMSETATNNAFNYDATARTIKVNYGKLSCNDENADAFYSYETFISAPTSNKTFKLYRPFAQINIGTDDFDKASLAGMNLSQAGMTVTACADVLDLATGSASVSDASKPEGITVTYGVQGLPDTADTADGAFPANTDTKQYSYLTMGYVLVPGDKTGRGTTNVSLNVPGKAPFATYPSVPVQANYRTNIFGSLLTNTENFTVTINPAFEEPSNNIDPNQKVVPWDGTTKKPAIDDNAKTISVSTPEELAWLAAQLGNENNQYAAYSVTLNSDLDLNDKEWTAIGNQTHFAGTFDGNNHTIKNFRGNLFNNIDKGQVKNVVIDNAKIFRDGAVARQLTSGGLIENVTVNENCTFNTSYTSQVGGIVAFVHASTVNKCTNNANITGKSAIGGIVGTSYSATITNCKNTGTITAASSLPSPQYEGIGGIVGMQVYGGKVAGCINEGNIVSNAPVYFDNKGFSAGGIIGMIRYSAPMPPNANPGVNGIVEVSGCNNSGSVTSSGSEGGGGIVGIAYVAANIHDNNNSAPSINAKSFASGIVGEFVSSSNKGDYLYLDATPQLVVKNNTSTTEEANIKASKKATIVYTNGSSNVTVQENTPANREW